MMAAAIAVKANDNGRIGVAIENPERFGSYRGRLLTEFLEDGRLMELVEPYTFIDRKRNEWPVPARTRTDGASIPRPLWSIIGGPFEGKYRVPAIIHDYYCSVRTRAWQATHVMFYEAMRASGVGELHAKMMYAGVYFGGPRWTAMDRHNAGLERLDDQGRLFSVAPSRIGRFWLDNGMIRESESFGGQSELIQLPEDRELSKNDFPKADHIVMDVTKLEQMIVDVDPDIEEIRNAIDFGVFSLSHVP